MESFDELLVQAEIAHGHLCAGQILGVRMAMLACQRLPKRARHKSFDIVLHAIRSTYGGASAPDGYTP